MKGPGVSTEWREVLCDIRWGAEEEVRLEMEARSLSDTMIFSYAMGFSFLLCPFKELDVFLQASVQIINPHPTVCNDMTAFRGRFM